MAEELLKKIPPEKRWEITVKFIGKLFVMRGEKIIAPILGKGEGILSHIWGAEKWYEITDKIVGDAGRQFFPWVKETFNIPVEDAIGAANLLFVTAVLAWGPELKSTIVEATPERVVVRWTKCSWWNRWEEHEVDPAFIPCETAHQANFGEGLKVINPKLTYKLTKLRLRGDPYCEGVIEFKDE